MEEIRVLIVDDVAETQGNYREILSGEEDFQVIAEVINGEEAIKKVKQFLPNVVIIDLNLSIMNGITVAEKITLDNPDVAVILVINQGQPEDLKKAMIAGARDCLIKPFKEEELIATVRRVYHVEKKRLAALRGSDEKGRKQSYKIPQIITILGTKGGCGKTTLSVNLAVQLMKLTMRKVVVVDLDLQFGDVPVFLNLFPKRSIAELVQERDDLTIDLVEGYLMPHVSGIKILPAPMRPEYAELVTADNVLEILAILRQHYDYIIIDTPPFFPDTVLSALDMSDQILALMSMDVPSIKNMKLSLELLETLHHVSKTKLLLNRVSEDFGITVADVEGALEFLSAAQMPSDGKLVVKAANRGKPFVLNKASAKISKAIEDIAKMVIYNEAGQNFLREQKRKKSFLGKLLG